MDNGQFLGFRNKPINDKDISDPENNFTIQNCMIFLDNKPKPFTFTIRLLHGTTIVERVFSVDSEQERLTWKNLIEEVRNNLQKEDAKPRSSNSTCSKKTIDSFNTDTNCTLVKKRKKKITFENFEFLKVLGKGTYGKVILCREKSSNLLYAIKILKKEVIIKKDEVEHTMTENRVLQSTRHPFLIGLKYSFTTQDRLCFVMEYVNGGELFFHLSRDRQFSEDATAVKSHPFFNS